jgi:diguanylate cyclase (GGDEF)-like protein
MSPALAQPSLSPISILLVEDNKGDALLIEEALEDAAPKAFLVSHASTLEMAEPQYRQQEFNVLLLDLNLPGVSGMEAVEKLRADLPTTPIIVMTGLDDEKRALGTMQRGAQDYIVKGQYGNNILPRVIRYAIERKRFETRVIELVHFDQITGLINREVFLDRLEGVISLANQNVMPLAVMLLSLRRFKDVTATLGHEVGNKLLKAVAVRLKECLMRQDAIARLEGDEFILLIAGQLASPESLAGFCQQIIEAIERPFEINDHSVRIGCSIGVATYPSCGKDAIELAKHADISLHRARQNVKNTFLFYTQTLNQELNERITLEKELQAAIKRQELLAYYQPIVDLKSNRICGVETLMRWKHAEKGFIPPNVFIPLAEKSELILEISDYVMKQACKDFLSWKDLIASPFYVAVNLSARDFQQKDFVERLGHMLKATGMNPKDLALEVTEGTLMENPQQAIGTLTACRALGAAIFVDDFGTGYSSLSYLSKLPLDILKIDRSFVADITTNGHNLLIATATINLAHALNLKVVAEGIETKEQKELLSILGCDKAQGYYFAKPMPASELVAWLGRDSAVA